METPLYKQLYTALLEEIKSGKLKSGDRVPSEKELADQFNVSRITSKKALEILMQAGVIDRARGKGSFVAKTLPDLNQVTQNLSLKESPANSTEAENDPTLIGLIIEDFDESYGMPILKAIEERCSERNCHLLLKRSYGRREEEERAIRSFQQIGVDGLIVFPVHGDYYNASLLRMVLDGFSLVIIDRYLKGIAACAIYTDNKKAGQELTAYLLDHGHTEIAFVSPPAENTSTIEERIQGFAAAFIERGLKYNPQHVFTELQSTLPLITSLKPAEAAEDYQALQNFIEANPDLTAFVACEYGIAQLLVAVLRRLGKRVPEDYTVVCFDSPPSQFEPPFFTHIQQDQAAMGRQTVDLLLAQLQGAEVTMHNVVNHRLVEGHSVKVIKQPTELVTASPV